jgi:membrane protein implicated in regulation of membrane protease activity
MGKTETDGNNLMLDIHKELLQEIRERERDILKFWAIFISAFGSWILAAGKFLDNFGKCNEPSGYLWIFLVVSVFALILLAWGLCLVLYYGYHYRMFQKVLYAIEEKQNLTKEGIIPHKWNPCGELLFYVCSELQQELQTELNDKKTEKLKEVFEKSFALLNPKVTVKEKDYNWKIKDKQQKDKQQVYIIKKEEGKLNVYTEKKPNLPELYKVHCFAFISAIILIVIASFILLCVFQNMTYWYYIALAFLFTISIIIGVFYFYFYRRYRKKMKELCSKEDQICKK